eukprot:10177750-Prorocentrum_lima.AAC.1
MFAKKDKPHIKLTKPWWMKHFFISKVLRSSQVRKSIYRPGNTNRVRQKRRHWLCPTTMHDRSQKLSG